MINEEIAEIFYEIADIQEMLNIPWKPLAFRKAAKVIESMNEDLEDIYKKGGIEALMEIEGIGEGIAKKIVQFIKTGKVEEHQKLIKKFPINFKELRKVEGLGPKKMKLLYQKLKITNLQDLEKAAKEGKIRSIPTLGEKTEQNILKAIEFMKSTSERIPLGIALNIAEEIVSQLKKSRYIDKIEVAGSIRRRKETIGDIDILTTSSNPNKVMDYFTKLDKVKQILARGPTKATVIYNNIEVDLRVLKPEEFGSALQYFTGSKEHNIKLRKIAISQGYKLNEYGLFKNEKRVAGKTEEEIYQKLGLKIMPPELREDRGEIEASMEGKLPNLINLKDIKGDLHLHTNWSDGENTIEEMIKKAITLNYKYIAITDHLGSSTQIAGSLSEEDFIKQAKEIEKLRKKYPQIKILHGCEASITKEGLIDVKNDLLKQMDIVIAGIHMGFKGDIKENTQRLIKAMDNPFVNIIAHPTGRLLGQRPGYEIDIKAIAEKAKQTKTALEINASYLRLDLNDINIKKAKEFQTIFSIDTDSHSTNQMDQMKLGVFTARRGWCETKDILNTLNYENIKKMLRK